MKNLTEKEAEDLLEKEGFRVAKRVLIKNKDELKKIKLPFPWAMKISSRYIVHKAKMGGIVLNITDISSAENAFDKFKSINHFEGILVQEMILGEELIIGLKKTPEFGLVVMIGKGGSKVEEEKDVSFRVIPLSVSDAGEMIREIKFYDALKKKGIHFKVIEENLIKISKLAEKYPDISELDINPLIVNSSEGVIVDARIGFD